MNSSKQGSVETERPFILMATIVRSLNVVYRR